MTTAATSGAVFHLWWHPHNFGVNVERNIEALESILKHYIHLRDQYGMRSQTMFEAAQAYGRSVPNDNRRLKTR
jgi:hypothetical protein